MPTGERKGVPGGRGRRRRRSAQREAKAGARPADYRNIVNTLPRAEIFSVDQLEAINDAALRVLEELGIRILLKEGRELFAKAGARIHEESDTVFIGRDIVADALNHVPRQFTFRGRSAACDLAVGGNSLMFAVGAGCPNITDLNRGRRPGTFSDFHEATKLQQSFAIVPKLAPSIEPQDLPLPTRHLDVTRTQLALSDKVPFVYARGRGQVMDSFEMMRLALGLDQTAFCAEPRTYTVVNTNSPRQPDRPMAQGIIDFARHRQPSIITPFCLAGAMAPITVPGALTLSHAEALAGITLAQLSRRGAPVVYAAFSSNVDMKSGAPVFGTPEHIKANFGAGQLARMTSLPWRSAAGTASNVSDVQAANETQLALWGAVLAGANLIYHASGWLEGGLTFSMEKFITDMEVLRVLAETMRPVAVDDREIGFDAITEVQPGGHFFATRQTMERYQTAFYEPLVADWLNYGQWSEAGQKTATERANSI